MRNRIRSPSRSPAVRARLRQTVEEAVRRGVVVNLTYLDADQNLTERSVESIGFYLGTNGWFLNGWCELRQAGRIFRLDRIRSAHLTKRRVQPRDMEEVLGWIPNEARAP